MTAWKAAAGAALIVSTVLSGARGAAPGADGTCRAATQALYSGRYPEALRGYRGVLTGKPDFALAHWGLSRGLAAEDRTPGDQEIGGYKEIPLLKLSEPWQRRVETVIFMGDINKISDFLNWPQPPGWLVRPETGHFRLQGRSFDFVTIRDTGDPRTSSTEAWGWILEK